MSLNGDLSRRLAVDTNEMEWQPSPSGTVLRKRLHLVGEVESGQVTSLVRYLPDSSFPEHEHPEGEEIFVLEGTFSDHLGHARAGTHLLNPEGFAHAPYSEEGCLIFVKLRQYDAVAGVPRPQRRTATEEMDWEQSSVEGVEHKPLFSDPHFPDTTRLERWAPSPSERRHSHPGGAEIWVIHGELHDEAGTHGPGTWLRLPVGTSHTATAPSGCTLYVKTGALPSLRSETSQRGAYQMGEV